MAIVVICVITGGSVTWWHDSLTIIEKINQNWTK